MQSELGWPPTAEERARVVAVETTSLGDRRWMRRWSTTSAPITRNVLGPAPDPRGLHLRPLPPPSSAPSVAPSFVAAEPVSVGVEGREKREGDWGKR